MVLDLVKFIPDFISILQLDYWCLFYVYTEKAVGSHIKSLRHKKARPPTKTGFQSREITALNAPPRGPSPVPLMWSRQKRGGPLKKPNKFLKMRITCSWAFIFRFQCPIIGEGYWYIHIKCHLQILLDISKSNPNVKIIDTSMAYN